jgi:hypothetical protein
VRARLVKRGGIGYRQPSPASFPPVGAFMDWVASCGAIPMLAWLDGTSPGEADPRALLDTACAHGVEALNIIPDRNWNVADEAARARKVGCLAAVMEAARERDLPVNIGTEMNKAGLPFVDRLDAPALRPYRETFLSGARIMVGQTLLARYADLAYAGERAAGEFPRRADRNRFFEAVGAMPALTEADARRLEQMDADGALSWLRKASAA